MVAHVNARLNIALVTKPNGICRQTTACRKKNTQGKGITIWLPQPAIFIRSPKMLTPEAIHANRRAFCANITIFYRLIKIDDLFRRKHKIFVILLVI